jgi:hypothetical protein
MALANTTPPNRIATTPQETAKFYLTTQSGPQ